MVKLFFIDLTTFDTSKNGVYLNVFQVVDLNLKKVVVVVKLFCDDLIMLDNLVAITF